MRSESGGCHRTFGFHNVVDVLFVLSNPQPSVRFNLGSGLRLIPHSDIQPMLSECTDGSVDKVRLCGRVHLMLVFIFREHASIMNEWQVLFKYSTCSFSMNIAE